VAKWHESLSRSWFPTSNLTYTKMQHQNVKWRQQQQCSFFYKLSSRYKIPCPIPTITLCYSGALLIHSDTFYYCQTGAVIWDLPQPGGKNCISSQCANDQFPGQCKQAGTRMWNHPQSCYSEGWHRWQWRDNWETCKSSSWITAINISTLGFYMPDALPDSQSTVSKQ